MKSTCNQCGREFTHPSKHWSQSSSCTYPSISSEKMDILTGLMMGDGCCQHNRKNALVHVRMINEDFISWLDERLEWLTNGYSLAETAQEKADSARETEFTSVVNDENYHDYYGVYTICHPDLNVFKSWYGDDGRVIPESVRFNNRVLKYWFVSDGSLIWPNDQNRPRSAISSRQGGTEKEVLLSLLYDLGIDCYSDEKGLLMNVNETEKLIEKIGPAPPGFEYKFCIEDEVEYRRKRQQVY